MTSPNEYISEPDAEWWNARPGKALESAFQAFEHGIAYYGLSLNECREEAGLSIDTWLALRNAYSAGLQLATVARALTPPMNAALMELPPAAPFLDPTTPQLLVLLECAPAGQTPCGSIDHPDAPYHLFATTLLLELTRIMPGVNQSEGLGSEWITGVNTDEVLLDRALALRSSLVALLSVRTAAFLPLVARCYLLGMAPELSVMSRAALEAAAENLAPDEAIVELIGAGRRKIGLERRLDYCLARDFLTRAEFAAALRIKVAGDDVVHLAPGYARPIAATLADLTTVLSALGRVSPAEGTA